VPILGLALIVAAAATALFLAVALRLSSLVATLLVAYLAWVGNLGLVTLALSPVRDVTRTGLALSEIALLVLALAVWWLRGRPRPPLDGARRAVREVVSNPLTAVFLGVVVLLLSYELLLCLTVPPNNMDSLTYHLAKAAAWAKHGGWYWIPNPPWIELDSYQWLAEQQNLFLMVATGGAALYALPQFLAMLAVLVAVYGASRRLGFDVRRAACSAFLLSTFSVFALEATTAQNDLVAASFPAVAVCLLLGDGALEPALGGAAVGLGLGVKLTTGLVIPVLLGLALVRGRRTLVSALAGGVVGFVALGMWSYVFDRIHTGSWLGGPLTSEGQFRGSPGWPRSVANAFWLMYGSMDLSVLSNRLIYLLAAGGVLAALTAGAVAFRRAGPLPPRLRRAGTQAVEVATPFLAPLLVLGGAALLVFATRAFGFPLLGPGGRINPVNGDLNETYTRISNEDYSAFGPLGIVALLLAAALTVGAYVARRTDARQLVLAFALPVFLVLISLETTWHPFLMRFFMLPAVLTAPLLARLFQGGAVTAAYVGVAALIVALTITHDQAKPLHSPYGYAWNLTQATALDENSRSDVASAYVAYESLVPPHACVGALLGMSEPYYVLYLPRLEHRVDYLPVNNALQSALQAGLSYVVIDPAVQGQQRPQLLGVLGSRRVYLLGLDDRYHWIPTPAVFAGLGLDPKAIIWVGNLPEAPGANATLGMSTAGPPKYAGSLLAGTFHAAGWAMSSLGGYWLLATKPHAGAGTC
jgi:hypothetical protein